VFDRPAASERDLVVLAEATRVGTEGAAYRVKKTLKGPDRTGALLAVGGLHHPRLRARPSIEVGDVAYLLLVGPPSGEGFFLPTPTFGRFPLTPVNGSRQVVASFGGVDTYVVVAEPRRDWLPTYSIAKIIYWVDQQYFFPLRIEQYDDQGELKTLQVRSAERQNPELPEYEGYTAPHSVYWDARLDLLSYSLHDGMLLYEWSEGERETLFNPDFMRRRWMRNPAKSQGLVFDPKYFHLHPRLLVGRFPDERTIEIAPEILARIEASNAAGRLVFVGGEGPDADSAAQ